MVFALFGWASPAVGLQDPPATVRPADQPASRPVIDSLLPMAEELRRFRQTVPRRATRLEGGSETRDALIARFVGAIEAADRKALARMLVDRAEFAYLYFPSSEYREPPYRQKPGLVWFRISNLSSQAIGRVLARDGGKPLGFVGYRCPPEPSSQGRNRIWRGCFLTLWSGGETRVRPLLGSILERDGRFKFLSFSSDY